MRRTGKIVAIGVAAVILLVFAVISVPGFDTPYSAALYAEDGTLLGARIASDGQWRFQPEGRVPERYAISAILFEDRFFYKHPGFNPFSIVRAALQNIRARSVVSGGSTITMQVIRLARKGKPRTFGEKLIELFLAVKMELTYSKSEILTAYTAHAPFGGNVVGIEAASWRYFGRSPHHLSWAEAATLAVLPNAPALVFPGKNETALLVKRNRLLQRLQKNGDIDSLTCGLAMQESLPGKPRPLPQIAPHLLPTLQKENCGNRIITTIDTRIQNEVIGIMNRAALQLSANEVHNAAALVVEPLTGKVLAYYGNTPADGKTDRGNEVDIIRSPRSSGSILKPFLYAAMLDEGELLPGTLVPDIPVFINGYSPKNYALSYDGAVPAKRSLARSLNIPATLMLASYGTPRFHHILQKLGMSTLVCSPDHYGLSLILGGAEASLWEMVAIYAGMARVLAKTPQRGYMYSTDDFSKPICCISDAPHSAAAVLKSDPPVFSAAAIWLTFEALLEVNRPDSEAGWEYFGSAGNIAWKTGTSFGFRDAWAIGVTPGYVVGVWAGNAGGEGRPELTGITAAAPALFDIFKALKPSGWFSMPYDELTSIPVCRESGFLASHNCLHIDTILAPAAGMRTKPCPYHKIIHLDESGLYQVNSSCNHGGLMIQTSWFVLPPVMEYYYKLKNPLYRSLPPLKKGCNHFSGDGPMAFIYPEHQAKMYLPLGLSGKKNRVVFEAAHRDHSITLYWHINNVFVGSTKGNHQLSVSPEYGNHVLTVVDSDGNSIVRPFTIVSE